MRSLDVLIPSPLTALRDGWLTSKGVSLLLKRDDLIHPDIPGNKWRKLHHNLVAARERGHRTLLTFGGAYSNHIRATAAAGRHFGFSTIGVIRGEEHLPLNPSLAYAIRQGMTLTYLDRTAYRNKTDPVVLAALRRAHGDFYLLPEGGTNPLGVRGCAELAEEIDTDFDLICCACGTGGTLAGIAAALKPGQRGIGFSALKGGDFLARDVADLQRRTFGHVTNNWTIETAFHFGGYAKRTTELESFIDDFQSRHGLELEWVYVAKMMYGLFAMVADGSIPAGSRIVALITGPAETW